MKSDEVATDGNQKRTITVIVVIIIMILSLTILFLLQSPYFSGIGGDKPEEPDEVIIVGQYEVFNISIKDAGLPRWVFVNEIDAENVNPFRPIVEFINYNEENYTYTHTSGGGTSIGLYQNWAFISNETGQAELFFYEGEYPDMDLGGFCYDYWVRVIVEE